MAKQNKVAPVAATPVAATPVAATPVAATPVAATPVAATPVAATPVAATPVAAGLQRIALAAAQAGAAPVLATLAAQPHLAALPAHLATKVASAATGGTQVQVPAGLQGYTLAVGKPHGARAVAEKQWAGWLQSYLAANGPQTAQALLAAQPAGMCLGVHTLVAYTKRGWLVRNKA